MSACFFFSSRRRHTRCSRDWSSDVCSSDLPTCHGLGTRAPNLLTDEKGQGPIGARCGKREPGKSCKQYLYESLDQPGAYIVEGYQPIMPVMTKQLSPAQIRSEEHTSELQSRLHIVCRLLLEKKKTK